MLTIGVLHLLYDCRDSGCVDVRFLHQPGGPPYVVGINRVEEVIDFANSRQSFQDESALEVRVIHRSPRSQWSWRRRIQSAALRCTSSERTGVHLRAPEVGFGVRYRT